MFSESYNSEIRQYFDRQMALLNDRREELGREEAGMPEADRNLWHFSRELLEQKIEEIKTVLAGCTEDEAEALRFLYSAMPLSDMLDYPAAVYLAYAKHGVFLWQEGPFAGKVPEKLFANYVLHHRVHNEDIADTRSFFYNKLKQRTAGKSMYEAAVETNFWCAEKATYQSTFMRTQNPLTMYKTAIGRCGEEAPFASTALRSIGIPAREVAAPWWAHCDDNHAWVEAWCDGSWHFLGGCEPEESLDKGWFKGPAARGMLVESRWFGKDAPEEPVTGHPDMSAKLNHLRLYADTVELNVRVEDEAGNPVPGARVDFALLNYGRFNSIASITAGAEGRDCGRARLETGYGDLLVCAYGNGLYGERQVSLGDASRELHDNAENRTEDAAMQGGREDMLRDVADQDGIEKDGNRKDSEAGCTSKTVPQEEYKVVVRSGLPGLGEWRDMDFHAPKEIPYDERKTQEQFAAEKERLESAADSRQRRAAEFYDEEAAQRVLMRFSGEDKEELERILRQSKGNMGEIVRFLEWDFAGCAMELVRQYGQEKWKLEALKTLRENDYWDIRAEVLTECCVNASPYAAEFPQEVFFESLLAPCAMFEKPRAGREALAAALGKDRSEMIRQNPQCLPGLLAKLLVSMPEQEYANLVTSSLGCLTGGIGSGLSRAALYIQIYRSLGIPARMRPMDRTIEYYRDGRFVAVALEEGGNTEESGKLILQSGESLKLEEWKRYSLSRFQEGRFSPLFIRPRRKKSDAAGGTGRGQERNTAAGEGAAGEKSGEDDSRELELAPGIYRLVTTNRLPNGDQFARIYDFRLEEGETKLMELDARNIPAQALLDKKSVEDMALATSEGEETSLLALGGRGRSLFLWLELAKEPTEHILNEICERKELFGSLAAPVYFVVRRGTDYETDATLKRAREALPGAKVLLEDFGEAYGALAYQAGRNSGKLPLAVVLEDGKECVYSDAGYNVGMADLLLRVLA